MVPVLYINILGTIKTISLVFNVRHKFIFSWDLKIQRFPKWFPEWYQFPKTGTN